MSRYDRVVMMSRIGGGHFRGRFIICRLYEELRMAISGLL